MINLAKQTSGVKNVHTYLKTKQERYECSSFNILANLKQNLFSDSIIKGTNVRVSVVGCDVVFSGVISKIEQEKHAIWYAKHIDGVQEVYSFLKILN